MALQNATFNLDRTRRHTLARIWDQQFSACMFIGLNPSTADEREDDATIRKCIKFAKGWGFGGIYMLNLFPYRATEPKHMMSWIKDQSNGDIKQMLSGNIVTIKQYLPHCDQVVFCWGGNVPNHEHFEDFKPYIARISRICKKKSPMAFKLLLNGQPGHPLYLTDDARLFSYSSLLENYESKNISIKDI